MAGAQFEYDKSGGTSYYFITTFFALALIPTTYYFWPRKKKSGEDLLKKCYCDGCRLKFSELNSSKPKHHVKNLAIKAALILAWMVFLYLSYSAAKVEKDFNEYDPYSILEIDRGVTASEIKKKYRQLSALYHPDVKDTGDSDRFMKIAKAYAALTDEQSRKNWEEFGNPDGPGATQFGIALPAWIVEKGNSIWVLTAYIVVFMIILPVIVGTWWYRSIKYSGDKVLIDTSQMYMYFFHKTPNMMLKRVIMILAASFEFSKFYNTEVSERPSDNVELPQLLKQMTNLNEKNKERPLSAPYSIKARILMHAHLSRLDLPPNTLEIDRKYILKKCPVLLNEMVNCIAQLMAFANSGRIQHSPRLETMENVMKCSQMLVQGLWEYKSPLLILPHIGDDILKHCITKKYAIRTIKDLAAMKDADRRSLLNKLSDREYADVAFILSKMPLIDMEVSIKVIDDEDASTITANSIVTVTVQLTRSDVGTVMTDASSRTGGGSDKVGSTTGAEACELDNKDYEEDRCQQEDEAAPDDVKIGGTAPVYKPKKKPVWKDKGAKKKKGGPAVAQAAAKKKNNGPGVTPQALSNATSAALNNDMSTISAPDKGAQAKKNVGSDKKKPEATGEKSTGAARKKKMTKTIHKVKKDASQSTPDSDNDDDDERRDGTSRSSTDSGEFTSGSEEDTNARDEIRNALAEEARAEADACEDGGGEGEGWDQEFQETLRKQERMMFDPKTKETHETHCPAFPEKKYERWWLYMADRKHSTLITAPIYITSLKETEEFQLKFPAPPKPGIYPFTVILRSDSYLDCDFSKTVKLDVKEEKKMDVNHPQWDISDSEHSNQDGRDPDSPGKKALAISDMEYTTEEDDDDSDQSAATTSKAKATKKADSTTADGSGDSE